MSLCLPACLPLSLFFFSISLSLCLSFSICYICLSLSLLCLYLSLPVFICLYWSLSVSICLYLSLSVFICLYLSLSVSICVFSCSVKMFAPLLEVIDFYIIRYYFSSFWKALDCWKFLQLWAYAGPIVEDHFCRRSEPLQSSLFWAALKFWLTI